MELKKAANSAIKVVLPLLLGGVILYWMYRDFDFGRVWHVLSCEMNWLWMVASMPFGILAQAFRGWRWRMALDPIGEHPRRSTCVNAVFLSYASSLVVPRIGEFVRCGVLRNKDGVSFAKSLGTVVTERIVDMVVVGLMSLLAIGSQLRVFDEFFSRTGTNIGRVLRGFTTTGYVVSGVCAVAAILMAWILLRKFAIYNKVRATIGGLVQGVMSLRHVGNLPAYLALTIGIWLSYFLHYYLTFFCFSSLSDLGASCALVTFIAGSIAVIVPTPNGAGPWHFAVKTMLILYGVGADDALYFVLIVHALQTLLVILLGIYAWAAVGMTSKRQPAETAAA